MNNKKETCIVCGKRISSNKVIWANVWEEEDISPVSVCSQECKQQYVSGSYSIKDNIADKDIKENLIDKRYQLLSTILFINYGIIEIGFGTGLLNSIDANLNLIPSSYTFFMGIFSIFLGMMFYFERFSSKLGLIWTVLIFATGLLLYFKTGILYLILIAVFTVIPMFLILFKFPKLPYAYFVSGVSFIIPVVLLVNLFGALQKEEEYSEELENKIIPDDFLQFPEGIKIKKIDKWGFVNPENRYIKTKYLLTEFMSREKPGYGFIVFNPEYSQQQEDEFIDSSLAWWEKTRYAKTVMMNFFSTNIGSVRGRQIHSLQEIENNMFRNVDSFACRQQGCIWFHCSIPDKNYVKRINECLDLEKNIETY